MANKIETMPDHTGEKQVATRFQPGRSGNPAGRPRGARSKLGERFIEALAADFDEHGDAVIKLVRARDPVAYIKVIKDTLPREVVSKAFTAHANVNIFANASDIEDAAEFGAAFRLLERGAREAIGAEPMALELEPVEAADGG
jgi:hypothetical protein